MIESTLTLDTAIIKDFSPLIYQHYKNFVLNNKSTEAEISFRLDIEEKQYDLFGERYNDIMKLYNIPEVHQEYLLYITQTVYDKADLLDEYHTDRLEALDVLKFLQQYRETTSYMIELKKRKVAVVSELDIKFKYQHSPVLYSLCKDGMEVYLKILKKNIKEVKSIELRIGNEISFQFKNSSRFIMDSIVRGYKYQTSNFYLARLFLKHNSVPSLRFINSAIREVEFIKHSPFSIPIIETIIHLYKYMDTHMKGLLSRKKQALVYDIFYLFDFLVVFTKQDKGKYNDAKRNANFFQRRLLDSQKNAFIERVMTNYKRRHIKL